jgi:hypothetical protein
MRFQFIYIIEFSMTKYLGYMSVFLCDLRFTNTNNDTKLNFAPARRRAWICGRMLLRAISVSRFALDI